MKFYVLSDPVLNGCLKKKDHSPNLKMQVLGDLNNLGTCKTE